MGPAPTSPGLRAEQLPYKVPTVLTDKGAFPPKRLMTPRGLTPHEVGCAQWQKNLATLTQDPPPSHWNYHS